MLESKLEKSIQTYVDEVKCALEQYSDVEPRTKELIETISRQVCYTLDDFKKAILEELKKN